MSCLYILEINPFSVTSFVNIEYLKLPVPLEAGRSPGKLVRQVRELSEGFGFKHS